MFIRYPEFPDLTWEQRQNEQIREYHDSLRLWWEAVKDELEQRDKAAFFGAANAVPWVVTSVAVTHTFNPTSATDTYTANRLGTLLIELKEKGIVT